MTEQAPRIEAPQIEVVDQEPDGPRVVVGVDGSAGGRAALLFALDDAARRGLPVEAVAAYAEPDHWMDLYVLGPYAPDQARTAAVERARTFVAEVLTAGPQPPPPVRLRVVRGSAADALVHAAHERDLLVVGSRGHGGFTSMLLGSVSMHCVLHAVCPVTVVHSAQAHRERVHLRRGRRSAVARMDLPVL